MWNRISTEGAVYGIRAVSCSTYARHQKIHKYWIASRHYINYMQKLLTFFLHFVSNPSSHIQLFCLAFFCSALTQMIYVLTISNGKCKGHLWLKRSTTKKAYGI